MTEKHHNHIFLDARQFGKAETYRAINRPGPKPPLRDRTTHANLLLDEIKLAIEEAKTVRNKRKSELLPFMEGIRLEFSGTPQLPLNFLESPSKGIYLLNTREQEVNGNKELIATVLFPQSTPKRPNEFFADKVKKYRDETTPKGIPKNDKLIRCINHIQIPQWDTFLFDTQETLLSDTQEIWCEVWVNRQYSRRKKSNKSRVPRSPENTNTHSNDETLRFLKVCKTLQIKCKEKPMEFPEQLVFLVKANREQLENLVASFDMLSSINRYREPSTFWLDMPASEQADWVTDLQNRLVLNPEPNCSVCVLDTGVNNAHPLLHRIIPNRYCHTIHHDQIVNDHFGSSAHGTNMCGIVAFGDLNEALTHQKPIYVDHAIESVRILPEKSENQKELYGPITSQAVSLAEIEAPHLNRVICMAVTAEGLNTGTPSAWSAMIDQISFGDDYSSSSSSSSSSDSSSAANHKRLFILSAGNIRNKDDWNNYPISNETSAIEDPAQSWNALTVGAYSEKCTITESGTAEYEIVAPPGGLSPYSRTSIAWNKNGPLKPDIVLEGGNLSRSTNGNLFDFESLKALTTSHDWETRGRYFAPFGGTSLAAAQAAFMAAKIYTVYPQAWAETVRGVLVHSARWTNAMITKETLQKARKRDIKYLIQKVGFGVPDLVRALHTLNNRTTMIIQDEYFHPYTKKGSHNQYGDIMIYELPWPKDDLLRLGDTVAEIRVTLSYFISPSPGEKGHGSRYRYPSFTLRFDVNAPGESKHAFLL